MKPFDFTTLKRGDVVTDGWGCSWTVLVTDGKPPFPVVVQSLDGCATWAFTAEGSWDCLSDDGTWNSKSNLQPPKRKKTVWVGLLDDGSSVLASTKYEIKDKVALIWGKSTFLAIKEVIIEEGEGME